MLKPIKPAAKVSPKVYELRIEIGKREREIKKEGHYHAALSSVCKASRSAVGRSNG